MESEGRLTVPKGVPVVLAPNHVNAFVDPTALAMLLKPKIRFFARGDVFKGRIAKMALDSLNISPMYRIQEGYGELKKNDKTFEECYQRLGDNGGLLLFPEALCIWGRRLRPLKKGTARIVFQTEENWNFKKEILVFPVGLNYEDGSRFRSRFYIHIGKPLSTSNYEAMYRENKVKAINQFTRDLETEMAKLLVFINNPENEQMVSCIEEIYTREWLEEGKDENSVRDRYYASREIAEMVNDLEKSDPEKLAGFRTKIVNYNRRVRGNDLRDHLFIPEKINKMNMGTFLLEYFLLFFGFPFYWLGLLFNWPPFLIARNFTNKKIRAREFKSSVYSTMAMVLYIIIYPLELLAIALIFRNWLLLGIAAIAIPLLGFYVLWFYAKMKKIFGRWTLLRMVRKERKTVEELIQERAEIIGELHEMKAHFKSMKK
jgi:1-acyl-sn-glycerol-3-phosphate acyltransferase